MHSAFCNGQVLLKQMNEKGTPVYGGTVWFMVGVEYTGEVTSARVQKSEINSDKFVQRVREMIMDSDFIPWQRNDEDTIFIYPMTFFRWWD
ncbi:MAG: hypothetical protein HUN04_07190 [Desulfobacter sp.]|nr:MAG: hypothetical protein HUN04_07190 [Desulfobacter sp.]